MLFYKGLKVSLDHNGAVYGDYGKINTPKISVVLPKNLDKWAEQFAEPEEETKVMIYVSDESDDHVAATLGIACVPNCGVSFEEAQKQPGGVLLLTVRHDEVDDLIAALQLVKANNQR